jgi:hypothetical protein
MEVKIYPTINVHTKMPIPSDEEIIAVKSAIGQALLPLRAEVFERGIIGAVEVLRTIDSSGKKENWTNLLLAPDPEGILGELERNIVEHLVAKNGKMCIAHDDYGEVRAMVVGVRPGKMKQMLKDFVFPSTT